MKARSLIVVAAVLASGLVSGVTASSSVAAEVHTAKHACTKTASGTCIKGGQFCPKKKYKKSGWDAKGRRYVCKGSRSHPRWLKP